jgi:antitoxin VapB
MPLNIRSDEVNRLAETLASRTHQTKTEAVKRALQNEITRLDREPPLSERLIPLQARFAARPATGLEADKEFYDSLNDE